MDAAKLLLGLIVVGAAWGPAELAAQSGWSGTPTAQPAASYDRYGQPIPSGAATISQRSAERVYGIGHGGPPGRRGRYPCGERPAFARR